MIVLAMTHSLVLASSGPVCTVMTPLLPVGLGCSCVDADSGVGGTSTCPIKTPAVPLFARVEEACVGAAGNQTCTPAVPAVTLPAMTFSIGATVLPCGTPASASVHGSIAIDLPAGISLPDGMEAQINEIEGVTTKVTTSQVTITIEKSVAAGGPDMTIDIPIQTGIVARIAFTVSGNIQGLNVTERLDICAIIPSVTAGAATSYCGEDVMATLSIEGAAMQSRTLTSITAGFEDACTVAASAREAPMTTNKVATSSTLCLSGTLADCDAAAQILIIVLLLLCRIAFCVAAKHKKLPPRAQKPVDGIFAKFKGKTSPASATKGTRACTIADMKAKKATDPDAVARVVACMVA